MNYFVIKPFKEYLKKYSSEDHVIVEPFLKIVYEIKHLTFNQILKKINSKNASFLNLIFFAPKEMLDFSKKSKECKEIFEYLDINNLQKIDAFELFAFTQFSIKGSMNEFLEYLVINMGDKTQNTISKDEFFYFIDGFYRGLTKLLLNSSQKKGVSWRLSFNDIEEIVQLIFANENFINIEDLQNFFLNNKHDPFIDFFYELKKSFNTQIEFFTEKEREKNISLQKKMDASESLIEGSEGKNREIKKDEEEEKKNKKIIRDVSLLSKEIITEDKNKEIKVDKKENLKKKQSFVGSNILKKLNQFKNTDKKSIQKNSKKENSKNKNDDFIDESSDINESYL